MRINPCVWQLITDMLNPNQLLWKPECKLIDAIDPQKPNLHCFDMAPLSHGFKYCPYCGGFIQEGTRKDLNS